MSAPLWTLTLKEVNVMKNVVIGKKERKAGYGHFQPSAVIG